MPVESKAEPERTIEACLARLASLLRGERAAVAAYRLAEGDGIDDDGLGAIRREHEEAVEVLSRRIHDLGGTLEETAGAWGGVTKAAEGAARVLGRVAALSALRLGEEHGAATYEEALSDRVVDSGSQDLILTTLLPRQRAHVTALDHRIAARRERRERRGADSAATVDGPKAETKEPAATGSRAESGKVGLALLMWLLGVPGILILAYLLFS